MSTGRLRAYSASIFDFFNVRVVAPLLFLGAPLFRSIWKRFGLPGQKGLATHSFHGIPQVVATDPIMGNLGDIAQYGSLHEYLCYLHKTYGPAVSFWWLEYPVVSLSTPNMWKSLRVVFDRPPALFSLFEPMIGKGSIQYCNGDEGRRRRKFILGSVSNDILDFARRQFNVIAEKELSLRQGRPFSLVEFGLTVSTAAITYVAFGDLVTTEERTKIMQCYNIAWHEMECRLTRPPCDPNTPEGRAFEDALAYMRNLALSVQHRWREQKLVETSADVLPDSFLDGMMYQELTDEERCDDIITMIVGGSHTTGNLLFWVLYYLTSPGNGAYLDQLISELDSSEDHTHPSSFMRAVLDESLRCSSLAPWAARVSEYDTELPGGGL